MKVCKRCALEKPETKFKLLRSGNRGSFCYRCCEGKPPLAAEPVTPVAPHVNPAQTAHEARQAERAKRDLKAEHSAILDENEVLRDRIAELVKMQKAPDVHVYSQPAWKRADAIPCAIASDWHVEETVEKEAVHGLNEYSLDIAKYRSEQFFKNFLRLADIQARDSKVNTIYIAALGDFFSGWIHQELLASTSLAPGDAARFWKGLFASGIDYLLRESSYTLEMDMLPGNHGRMTQQMHFSDPTGTSLETFAYHALAGRYEDNPRVRIRVADHAMVYRPFFEKMIVRLIHGYEVKYGGGVGGITIPVNKAIAQWDQAVRADQTWFGHFHKRITDQRFSGNGSLIGYNTFAQGIKASYEEAVQSFITIHARKGGQISVTSPIWLDQAHHDTTEVA